MGSEEFQKFYVQFYSLGKNLDLPDSVMATDLKGKIPKRLTTVIGNTIMDKKLLSTLRDLLLSSDNAYQAAKSNPEPKPEKAKKSGRYAFSAARTPTVAITGDNTVVKPKQKGVCYVCQSPDYIASYYSTDSKAKVPPA